ncbi:rhodanese-like domain-containing protein [Halanaerocella petrolearia]
MKSKKMKLIAGVLTLIVGLMLVSGCSNSQQASSDSDYVPIKERGYAHPESVISAKKLKEIKDKDDVAVFDFRHKAKYLTGHIPGAVQIYRSDEENSNHKFGGMRATPEQMEEMLQNKGVNKGDLIVIYDDRGEYDAARMWWLLTMYGYDNVKLLDGGIIRWKALGFDTNLTGPDVKKGNFEFDQAKINKEQWLATLEDVKKALDSQDNIILDTRTREEYTGEKTYTDRAGRIPGATWIEWKNAVNGGKSEGPRTFKTAKELKKVYQSKGITDSKDIIPYCQSAVRSSHTTFVLTQLLGYDNVRNYDESWIGWSAREELPIEQGE